MTSATGISAPRMPLRLTFAGDLLLGGYFLEYARKRGVDLLEPFQRILPQLRSCDLLMVNLEGPILTAKARPRPKASVLANDARVIDLLKAAPAAICNLANNHMLDFGEDGLLQTREFLARNGIHCQGAGSNNAEAESPLSLECGGWRIACMGATTSAPEVGSEIGADSLAGCASFEDHESLVARISALRQNHDLVIVSLHWGREYFEYPSDKQVELARKCVDAGASIVVGHHSHLAQGWEKYRDGVILYSLGHFFLPPFRLKNGKVRYLKPESQEFVLADCTFHGAAVSLAGVSGGRWDKGYMLNPYSGAAKNRFELKMNRLSAQFDSGDYGRFWKDYAGRRPRQLRLGRAGMLLSAWKQRWLWSHFAAA